MVRKKVLVMTLVAVILVAATFVLAEPQQAPAAGGGNQAPPAIRQVKPGLYIVTGIGGNTSVRVTNDGVAIVDTKNLGEQNYNALMAQIRSVTQQPVRYAFITHVHQDHSGNIGPFKAAGTQVIAHEGLAENLKTYTSAAGKPADPSVTFARDHVVRLGNVSVEAHHYAAGHTAGDSIVYFPDVKVVAMGDEMVNPQAPNCDYPQGGSMMGWLRSLNEVAKLDFDTVIPGHGNVMTRAEFNDFKMRLETFVDRSVTVARRNVPRAQMFYEIQQHDLGGWNITMPDARLGAFYNEMRAEAQKRAALPDGQ
jgi:glyoxylase-like metal-dependent hydrolase (beta-lactamase superfamily II)